MKINSNYTHTYQPQNFKGIRVVKTNPDQFFNFVENYTDFCNKNIVFRAISPEQNNFFEYLLVLADNINYSLDWTIKNCTKHNILEENAIENLPMMVFTGKDKIKLLFYNIKGLILDHFKTGKISKNMLLDTECPEHLAVAKYLKLIADDRLPKFQKFLEKNNAKHVSFEEFVNEVEAGKI